MAGPILGELSGFEPFDHVAKADFDGHLSFVDCFPHSWLVLFRDLAHTLHDISQDTFRSRNGGFISLELCRVLMAGAFSNIVNDSI